MIPSSVMGIVPQALNHIKTGKDGKLKTLKTNFEACVQNLLIITLFSFTQGCGS
jgi:hypothetical protein